MKSWLTKWDWWKWFNVDLFALDFVPIVSNKSFTGTNALPYIALVSMEGYKHAIKQYWYFLFTITKNTVVATSFQNVQSYACDKTSNYLTIQQT